MEMAGQEYGTLFSSPKGLEVHFTLQKDLNNARLRYITTGHGGWENGDEYLPKKNTITLDGKTAFAFVPWRQDCGTYRLYNPASGNFEMAYLHRITAEATGAQERLPIRNI